MTSSDQSREQAVSLNCHPEFMLELKGISFAYKHGSPILTGLDLSLKKNGRIGLSGPNGSGKTTLFRCITGLEDKVSGTIQFLSRIISKKKDFEFVRRHTGFVLQNAENQTVFPTVLEDVMFGPLNLGLNREKAHETAHYWLEKLKIEHLSSRIIASLSGGEKKLVALAGILAMRPQLLLLDEPWNELDANARERVCAILRSLDCAQIIASHEAAIFEVLNCPVYHLEAGKLTRE